MSTKWIWGALLLLGIIVGVYLLGKYIGAQEVTKCLDDCRLEAGRQAVACTEMKSEALKEACSLAVPVNQIVCNNKCGGAE